ncbi:uncharacterized protein [Drosophila tropicalis]|uniref:uncharacterized protein n=1 Tax=Drosophila tropicalis TaxID=46794 RepID=UPI0035AB957B
MQLSIVMVVGLIALIGQKVGAVPTSVLAQNSELLTNANNKLQQQQQQQEQQQEQQPAAVKRSPEDVNAAATVAPADKKSSPEIVPASFSNAPAARSAANTQEQRAGIYALPSNDEILAAVAAAAAQSSQLQQNDPTALEEAASSTLHKRGINYEYNPYMPAASNDYDVPSGMWADEYEPSASGAASAPVSVPVPLGYSERDLQELDEYAPERRLSSSSARNKAYDNLQNLLNAEAYLESIPLSVPLTYANRNYNLDERNKRGIYYNMENGLANENINLNKYRRYGDMRLKRDTTKLNPADMLALVALVEAGERARKESEVESAPVSAPLMNNEDVEYLPPGSWLDSPVSVQAQPSLVEYYGMPVEPQLMKYDYIPRQHKYGSINGRFGSSKRFMVAKKKRSVSQSQFMNEPVAERGPSYKGEKYF